MAVRPFYNLTWQKRSPDAVRLHITLSTKVLWFPCAQRAPTAVDRGLWRRSETCGRRFCLQLTAFYRRPGPPRPCQTQSRSSRAESGCIWWQGLQEERRGEERREDVGGEGEREEVKILYVISFPKP